MKWLKDVMYFKTIYSKENAQKILDICLTKDWEANSHDNIPTLIDFEEDGIVKKDSNNEYYSIFIYKSYIWIEDCEFGNEIINIFKEESQ
jgi:hypothetical protein